jgi:dihydrofolate reductase
MSARRWQGHVFIGVSVDGFIARPDGDVSWLEEKGRGAGDNGFGAFMDRVDHVLLGRVTYETVAGFGVWPYAGKQVLVLSRHLAAGDGRVRVVRSVDEAVALFDEGARNAYVDGGQVIRTFLAAGLVDELTLTAVPVLIGDGIRPFGPLPADLDLTHVSTEVLGEGLVQSRYRVRRRVQDVGRSG